MPKLNQIVAIESGIKTETGRNISDIYKTIQKENLFNGFVKKYTPKDDEGDIYPDEQVSIVGNIKSIIDEFQKNIGKLLDITLTKDVGNTEAFSDIVVDGNVVLESVPVTYLLSLEKQLIDIKTFISKLPILDESEEWWFDEQSSIWKTNGVKTNKTKKISKPIVLYEATKEHPAQVQLAQEDIIIGAWNTIKMSSCIKSSERIKMLENVTKLLEAVKFARERANSIAVEKKTAETLLNYIFKV